jgi:hypothetical protein
MAKFEPTRNDPQKPAMATPQPQPVRKPTPKPVGDVGWNPVWRWFVSLLIVLHISAVFCAPWDLSTSPALPPGFQPPTDNLGRQIPPALDSPVWQQPIVPRALHEKFFRHYLNLLYLNHGYEFFAPDPNGSHLIRYQISDSGGREVAGGQFPDLSKQWPRLLYHRHMMLAAQTGDMGEESGRHYAQHLLNVNGGHSIRTEWIIHKLLSPQDVKNGVKLDAPQTYQVLASIQEVAKPKPEKPVALPPTEGVQ